MHSQIMAQKVGHIFPMLHYILLCLYGHNPDKFIYMSTHLNENIIVHLKVTANIVLISHPHLMAHKVCQHFTTAHCKFFHIDLTTYQEYVKTFKKIPWSVCKVCSLYNPVSKPCTVGSSSFSGLLDFSGQVSEIEC